jgi:hypothetical protein
MGTSTKHVANCGARFGAGGSIEEEFGSTIYRLDEIGIHLMQPPSESVPHRA